MSTVSRFRVPDLGVGVGFRVPHFSHVIEHRPAMDWFEIISENFMVDGGSPLAHLDQLRSAYPVVPHGVSMSLGGACNEAHLSRLAVLVERLAAPWVSDHLCFTGSAHVNAHDLLPLPHTAEMRDHVVRRIRETQARVGLFALENVSSYLAYRASDMTEWQFLAEVAEAADCALLLDVNNVFVSSVNHGFDPVAYIDGLPLDRVVQIHLAGHAIREGYRLDTHDHPVCDEVWQLYAYVISRIGGVSTLIEWDDRIPPWDRLAEEAQAARAVRDRALGRRA